MLQQATANMGEKEKQKSQQRNTRYEEVSNGNFRTEKYSN